MNFGDMINIKDISGQIRFSTLPGNGSKRKFELMKEDYITLKFSLMNPVYFQLGDGIDNEIGIFELVDPYSPSFNTSTGGYDYELRLDAYYWKWKNKIFKYTPEGYGNEASWSLTANLSTHLNVFLRNLQAWGFKYRTSDFIYEIQDGYGAESKSLTYSNTNLIDALTMMAEAWSCEWWITDNVIHFGRCEYGTPVKFELGAEVSAMTRTDSQTKYATRIIAFGGEQNIPAKYRKDLVFINDGDGNSIQDNFRKLSNDYFPESALSEDKEQIIPNGDSQNEVNINSTTSTISYKRDNGNIMLNKGKYTFHTTGRIEVNILTAHTPSPAKAKTYISFNGNEQKIFEKEFKRTGSRYEIDNLDEVLFIDIEEDNTSVAVTTEVNLGNVVGANIKLYIYNVVKYKLAGLSASTSITVLTGIEKGKIYNGIFNPYFQSGAAANIIQLSEGTLPKGEQYAVNNLVRSRVPDSYFSNPKTEVTIEGVVSKRLMLPEDTPYIDAVPGLDNSQIVEQVVVFDDIYPKRIGTMSDISTVDRAIENEDGKEEGTFKAYQYKDSGLIFSEDYRIAGEDLKITFQSGKLNGLTFVVIFEPDGTEKGSQIWEIVRNEDYGRPLPDNIAFPEDGDKYVLSGFDPEFVSDSMIPDAEQELKKEAVKAADEAYNRSHTYTVNMSSEYMWNNGEPKRFEVGDKVNLINKAYFEGSKEGRILGYEYPLDFSYDHPVYTVGDKPAYSRLGALEKKVESLEYGGKSYSGIGSSSGASTSVYVIGSNDVTQPSDRNVFSALHSLIKFFRKDVADTAKGEKTFLDIVKFGEFIDSMLAGKGAGIFPDGRGQFERLEVRGSMTVMDLIINQIQGMESDYSFAEIGKISYVEDYGDGTYRLMIEKRTDFDFMKFQDNDVCFSIINTLLTGGSDYYTSWMRILTTNVQENSITVSLYPDSEVPGGTNYPPVAGYNLTRRGNSTLPEAGGFNERAQSWMLSSREGRIMFLANVYKPILEDYNYALTIGKLPNIKALEKIPVTTNDVGIVAQTGIFERIYQYDSNGDVVPNKVDRGPWSLSTAQGSTPYRMVTHETQTPTGSTYTLLEQHTVYHLGCKWGCLVDKTQLEPKWNSPAWEMLEGDKNYGMEFVSSRGWQFFRGQVNTDITAYITYSGMDITDDVMALEGIEVEWLRDSGNIPSDNSWKPTHIDGQLNTLRLTNDDMPPEWGYKVRTVMFICRIFIPVGGETQKIENYVGFNI